MYLITMGWLVGAPQYLSTRFGFDDQNAGNYAALISILPAFLSPFIAHIVDVKGKRAYWLIAGSRLLLIGHILFAVVSVKIEK